MNVLINALNAIENIINNQTIQIKTNNYFLRNGYPVLSGVATISTIAHIQPLNPYSEYKNTDFTIDSVKKYKFYILSDKITLINSQLKDLKNSLIIWDNNHYNPYEKEDWSLNGWICINATLVNDNDNKDTNV